MRKRNNLHNKTKDTAATKGCIVFVVYYRFLHCFSLRHVKFEQKNTSTNVATIKALGSDFYVDKQLCCCLRTDDVQKKNHVRPRFRKKKNKYPLPLQSSPKYEICANSRIYDNLLQHLDRLKNISYL